MRVVPVLASLFITLGLLAAPPSKIEVTVSPSTVTLAPGANQTFTASVSGTTQTAVNWSATGGTISPAGLFVAPVTSGTYSVKATSVANGTSYGSASVIVASAVAPTIATQPVSRTVVEGASATFSVVASGTGPLTYQWYKNGVAVSAANAASYSTPASVLGDSGAAFTVKVTNSYGSSTSNPAILTVTTAPISVTLSPTNVALAPSEVATFTATVLGSTAGVSWSVSGGSYVQNGNSITYTAPAIGGTYSIKATSIQDTTKSSNASVTLKAPSSISISPTTASVKAGETVQFLATGFGMNSSNVRWTCYYGTISNTGLFTAATFITDNRLPVVARIIATSLSENEPERTATSFVTILPSGNASIRIDSQAKYQFVSGETVCFTATVTGATDTRVRWEECEDSDLPLPISGGVIQASGVFVAPFVSYIKTYNLRVVSLSNPNLQAIVMVKVRPKGAIYCVTPKVQEDAIGSASGSEMLPGQQIQIEAGVYGGGTINWSTTGGTITSSGLLTAPSTPGSFVVTATNAADGQKKMDIGFCVLTTGEVRIQPSNPAPMIAGGNKTFTATVVGSNRPKVTWGLYGLGSYYSPGFIDQNGNYTAPTSWGSKTSRQVSVEVTNSNNTAFMSSKMITIHPSPQSPMGYIHPYTPAWVGFPAYAGFISNWDGEYGVNLATSFTWQGAGVDLLSQYSGDGGVVSFRPKTVGTMLLTATATNASGSTQANLQLAVTEVPDLSNVYTLQYSNLQCWILDFGTKNELRPDGSTHTYRQLWVGNASRMDPMELPFDVDSRPSLSGNFYGASGQVHFDDLIFNAQDGRSISIHLLNPTAGYKYPTAILSTTGPAIVGVEPRAPYLQPGATLTFQSAVGGVDDHSVTWSCSGGSITSAGVFTAPSQPGTYSVTATSNADPSRSYTSTVGVGVAQAPALAGVFSGTVALESGVSLANTTSIFLDGNQIYGRWNLFGAEAQLEGKLDGRLFQGTWMARKSGTGELVEVPFQLRFDLDANGIPSLKGTFTYWDNVTASYKPATYTAQLATGQVAVHILPNSDKLPNHLAPATTKTFKALVAGSGNGNVTWQASAGSLSSVQDGIQFTSPSSVSQPQVVTLTATSAANSSATYNLPIILDPKGGWASPSPAVARLTGTTEETQVQFAAHFPTEPTDEVYWSLPEGSVAGTIDPTGLFKPGQTPGVYSVIGTSSWDPTVQAVTQVSVLPALPKVSDFGVKLGTSYGYGGFKELTVVGVAPITFGWTTTGATSLAIDHGVGAVSGATGSITVSSPDVSVPTDVLYTLTATNTQGAKGQTILVHALPGPKITGFVATPSVLSPGQSASIVATFSGGTGSLDQGIGTIQSGVPVQVTPTSTTTYTLTVTGPTGLSTTSNVTVTVPPTITLTPGFAQCLPYGTIQFSAVVSNAPYQSVDWSLLEPNSGATLSMDGLYRAPLTPGVYHVRAVSLYDPSLVAVSEIQVKTLGGISVSPSQATLAPGGTLYLVRDLIQVTNPNIDLTSTWTTTGGTITPQGLRSDTAEYVAPATPGTYLITVTSNENTSLKATATIRVVAGASGTVSVVPATTTLAPGDSLAFAATVSSGGTVAWSASGGSITTGGVYTAPTQPGTHTIIASNGTQSGAATVNVTNLPILQSLLASPARIAPGSNTTLTWSVRNATTLKLDSGTGPVDVTGLSSKIQNPSADTTYSLTATNAFGSVVQSVRVAVTNQPVIRSFTATPNKVGIGDTVTLAWDATGADILLLNPGSLDVTGSTQITQQPVQDTTYILSANNGYGGTSQIVSVAVGSKLPALEYLRLDPASAQPGDPVTLSWSVQGADSVSLSTFGTVEATGSRSFTAPAQATRYTLTATNGYGTITPSVDLAQAQALKWTGDKVYGFGQLVSEDRLQGNGTAQVTYLQVDQVGTPRVITDGMGTMVGQARNLPFGERFGQTGVKAGQRFAGHEEGDTLTVYVQARNHLPAYGKFGSPDPGYDQHPADPGSLNLYSYVRNQPTHALDSNGLDTLFIHGTWSTKTRWGNERNPSPFVKAVLQSWHDVQGPTLDWYNKGHNNNAATRFSAAIDLLTSMKKLADTGKPINVVAHSHGGNVLFLASQLAAEYNKHLPEGAKPIVIGKAVIFGTPIRDDYTPDTSVLPNLLLVSNTVDDVQVNGGYNGHGDLATIITVLIKERGSEYGDAGRELPMGTGRTMLLDENALKKWGISSIDYAGAHSKLLDKPEFWNQVIAPLFQGDKKSGDQ